MKKIKVFGKELSILFVVGIVMAMGASAALVNYLSNSSEADIDVSSPVELTISKNGVDWIEGNPAAISFNDIFGGESVTFFARDENLADVDITGNSVNIVTCDLGLTCDDFASVEATTTSRINGVLIPDNSPTQPNPSGPWEIISLCSEVDANTVEFTYGPDPSTLVVGQADTTEITVTFKPNAVGNYVFTTQKMI